jgi:hypothetical protein
MAELWQLVQGLRGQTLQTPTGRGTFTVLDVDEHGLWIDVQGGGRYRLARDAIEAAAALTEQDFSAARIRRLGISDSQPSYIAAVVRAVRKQSLDATEMPDRAPASKYDTFWNSRISDLRQLVNRASRDESAELNATAITVFGNRVSWSGSADVNQVTVLSASMAHMVSLARIVAMSQICVPYPATAFHFAMSATGRLRITVARPPDQQKASLATATEDCHPLVGAGRTISKAPCNNSHDDTTARGCATRAHGRMRQDSSHPVRLARLSRPTRSAFCRRALVLQREARAKPSHGRSPHRTHWKSPAERPSPRWPAERALLDSPGRKELQRLSPVCRWCAHSPRRSELGMSSAWTWSRSLGTPHGARV